MMKKLYSSALIIATLLIAHGASFAQFKTFQETSTDNPEPEIGNMVDLPASVEAFQNGARASQFSSTTPFSSDIIRDEDGSSIYIDLSRLQRELPRSNDPDAIIAILNDQAGIMNLTNPSEELSFVRASTDLRGNKHFRFRQVYRNIPIYNGELIVHTRGSLISSLNGRWFKTPAVDIEAEILSKDLIYTLLRDRMEFRELSEFEMFAVGGKQIDGELVIFHSDTSKPILAYSLDIHPHVGEHLHVIADATTGQVIQSISSICSMTATIETGKTHTHASPVKLESSLDDVNPPVITSFDGDVTVNDNDLSGETRNIHALQLGTDFFLCDISRPMYNSALSELPNEPAGAIWTIDGNGGSPQNQDFEVSHVVSGNNNWAPLQVSAHWNGATAYEYFRTTFDRNSINGDGGTIISIIDVRESNGQEMDNAFWNGYAMFYGNGDVAFEPLAKALDVAGHEMSHGVIQNTANLEYVSQSGALNESFADIFGALIDREDWLMGEDVVNTNFFPSGALRDLSDPNNGGSQGDNGWQPAHMDEYVNLPNTPQGDNGGVHINSGIPNRAFFLFASEVGKDVAEQVYYHALDNYLVRSSQFIDARIAVISAAEDLYDSDVANAARDAFSAVGLGSGSGGNYEETLDVNPGDDFMLISDNDFNDLYFVDPGTGNIVALDVPPPYSRPSISDDGSAVVYVDDNGFLKAILFDWSGSTLDYEVIDLEGTPQPVWRNIAISKDGGRIAFITETLNNSLFVFDFVSQTGEEFLLFNPTTGTGGPQTGGVDFADALEWDYTGEKVMYDAQNTITGTFGDNVEYWDIGFIDAWDNSKADFGTGQIQKLFSTLPENVNIGNPSFAKNAVDIVVFDFVEVLSGSAEYAILATNIETGRVELIFENDALGYPNYSMTDELIVFDTKDPNGNTPLLVGAIDVNPGDIMDSDEASARIFIEGARWGTWFGTGTRDLLSSLASTTSEPIHVFPNPASETIQLTGQDIHGVTQVRIFDIQGKLVQSSTEDFYSEGIDLSVSTLNPGLYTVQVEQNGTVYTGRFMKL